MDRAEGELFRTRETVVGDSSRYSESVLRLTGPDGGVFFLFAMWEL
jgi:hypothetical protein